jgi:hypothetical protein
MSGIKRVPPPQPAVDLDKLGSRDLDVSIGPDGVKILKVSEPPSAKVAAQGRVEMVKGVFGLLTEATKVVHACIDLEKAQAATETEQVRTKARVAESEAKIAEANSELEGVLAKEENRGRLLALAEGAAKPLLAVMNDLAANAAGDNEAFERLLQLAELITQQLSALDS